MLEKINAIHTSFSESEEKKEEKEKEEDKEKEVKKEDGEKVSTRSLFTKILMPLANPGE